MCDPISCPQELSAGERWRKVRAGESNVGTAASSSHPEGALDLDADLDPEDVSEEWL